MTTHVFRVGGAGNIVKVEGADIVAALVNRAEVAAGLIVAADGRIAALEAEVEALAGGSAAALSRVASFDVQKPLSLAPGIHMVICNGQSKSRGYNSTPPISITASPLDKKLSGGLMLLDQASRGDYSTETLVPLVEAQIIDPSDNATPDGETIVSGAVAMIRRMMSVIDGNDGSSFSILAVAAGVSGAGIGILNHASQSYTATLDAIDRGKALADAAGKDFRVAFGVVEHGQTDTDTGTSPATFKAAWTGWRADMEAAGEALTGARPAFVTSLSQTSDHPAYGVYDPAIALAQGELDAVSGMVTCAPTYIFETGGPNGADGVHYSPRGSYMNGVYQGLAVYWRYYKGVDWHPLKPWGTKSLSGRQFTIPMQVPVRPLRLSTELVTDPGSYGFRLERAADGVAMPIASVAIAGDSVVVTAAEDPPTQNAGDYRIEYAFGPSAEVPSGPTTGARGCLCDSQGNYLRDPRFNRRLDNYALIFRV